MSSVDPDRLKAALSAARNCANTYSRAEDCISCCFTQYGAPPSMLIRPRNVSGYTMCTEICDAAALDRVTDRLEIGNEADE